MPLTPSNENPIADCSGVTYKPIYDENAKTFLLENGPFAQLPVSKAFYSNETNTSNFVRAQDNLETQYNVQIGLNLEADDMLQTRLKAVHILPKFRDRVRICKFYIGTV